MREEFDNCWFVYAASSVGDSAIVLTWCDDLAPVFTDPSASLHVGDVLDYEDGKNRPHEAGIFVWEGTYGYSNSHGTGVPEPECDEWFSGTIRRANPAERVSLRVDAATTDTAASTGTGEGTE